MATIEMTKRMERVVSPEEFLRMKASPAEAAKIASVQIIPPALGSSGPSGKFIFGGVRVRLKDPVYSAR